MTPALSGYIFRTTLVSISHRIVIPHNNISESSTLHRSARLPKMSRLPLLLIAVFVGIAIGFAPEDKIHPKLQQSLSYNRVYDIVVTFAQGTEQVLQNVGSKKYPTRGARISDMKAQLEALRDNSHQTALQILKEYGAEYQSMWVNNRIYVKNANSVLVYSLAAVPEVEFIREALTVELEHVEVPINNTVLAEWNIEKIEAPQAWALPEGNNGAGAIVASIDTGVRHTHEALSGNHRVNYGWYDPYTSTSEPVDEIGLGTHIMGTMVGSNGIGIAPGAQWIACRGCATSSCTEAALVACGQWIVCPTLANGESADCDQAPTIVSNSWGGGQGQNWYDAVIDAWISAGILPFFPVGSSGPSCGTAASPADNINVIAVGCTDASDNVCGPSSRGPASSGAVKPDITGPGVNIRSAWNTDDTSYIVLSGTSTSTPHAAGSAALLAAHDPDFTIAHIAQLLLDNTDRDLGPAATCGNTPPDVFPNNIYGYGRVNARKALEDAINGGR